MSFNLSFLRRQESSIFGIFYRNTFLDSRSLFSQGQVYPCGSRGGNDEDGRLFWTAFVKKGNLILELFQICPKVIKFQNVIC